MAHYLVFRNASSIIDDVEYAVCHFPDFAAANGIDRKFIDEIGGYLKGQRSKGSHDFCVF